MTRRTRWRLPGALLACGALVVAACSDYEGYRESRGLSNPGDVGVERSAGAAEGDDWNAVAPAKGGNGYPSDYVDDRWCFTAFNGDLGWHVALANLCFLLANETRRFTATPGEWATFPLTVSKFWTGNDYPALGGTNQSGYWGVLQGLKNCDSECSGRLSPNPFNDTAVMQFAGQGASGNEGVETAGIKTRLFLNSGAAPMRLSDASAQPYYDMPKWSPTNYHWCTAGAWLTCTKDPNMASKGTSVIARYRIGTLPLAVQIVNALGPKTVLERQGDAQLSGLLVDPVVPPPARIAPETTAWGGAYRAADARPASYTARYVVTDVNGNATPAACRATDTRPLGCGTAINLAVNIDQDGKNTSTCLLSTSDSRAIKCEVTVLGSPTGPMTAIVRVADF
jgi:hypothetical protein